MAESIGLVLSGGGARGAYEIGVLSELLPWLERDHGERPTVLAGTSIGAVNVGVLAAGADKPATPVLEKASQDWLEFGYERVVGPTFSPRALPTASRLAFAVLDQRVVPYSLLDTRPLERTLKQLLPDVDAINRNIDGALSVCAVVATDAHTSRSVVFHAGGPEPSADDVRRIDYVPTRIGHAQIRASAAIPVLFPAVKLTVEGEERWYFDGGTRLNTPLKPALELGAKRLIVIGLNSISSAPPSSKRADLFDGASQIVQGLFVDPLVNDVDTLAKVNERAVPVGAAGQREPRFASDHKRLVPYIFIAPQNPNEVGAIAQEVYQQCYSGWRGMRRCRDLALLGRFVGAGLSPRHGELFSYLFFAEEFAARLLELGRCDARRWIDTKHDDGAWQHRRLPRR